MKWLIAAIAIVLGYTSTAWAQAPVTLTSLHAIQTLTKAQACQGIPVAFEATVTYFRWYENSLFVQDGGATIYVQTALDVRVAPGDRVLVRGRTHNSFRTEVFADSVTVLHHGKLPEPVPAGFDQLIRGKFDSTLVKVNAVVSSADLAYSAEAPVRSIVLQMLTGGNIIQANVDSDDANALQDLLDAEVEVTGVIAGKFDGKSQLTGLEINVSKLVDIRILKRASGSPWSLPVTPMDAILTSYHEKILSQRILIHGVITYDQPGTMIVLQSGSKSLRVMTQAYAPLRIGDRAEATGFPDIQDGFLILRRAEVQDSHIQAPVQPLFANWDELASSNHIFDLVSIEGQVVMEVREAEQDEYVLVSGGNLFSAIYHHPDAASRIPLPAMKQIPVGSRVRVTGACLPYSSDPFSGPVPFDILLRSFDDISVVAKPSWLTVRNLLLLAGVLLTVVLAIGARSWTLERKLRRQTGELAYIEKRRGRILEEINGSRPLAEIVEGITELVSVKLRGAPCWCQIADGALLGNCPSKLSDLRVVEHEIPAHSGSAHGAIFAAFDPLRKLSADEPEALSMAVGLAALAIETRRMFSDLLHRSEFDLLTDIHNRFSLERYANAQIADARQHGGVFGLIYIDLNDFKQVNDLYGHLVGDLYLQELALRIKRQLRSVDMLARLGGDEFAVLVPVVHGRADVEEIALRLTHCFQDPFAFEGCEIHGSASVGIALYPEDGTTHDALLSTADAAMYAAKHARQEVKEKQRDSERPQPTLQNGA